MNFTEYYKKLTLIFFRHTSRYKQELYNLFLILITPKYEKRIDDGFGNIDLIFEKVSNPSGAFWRKILLFLSKHGYNDKLDSFIINDNEKKLWDSLSDNSNLLINGLYFLLSKQDEQFRILYIFAMDLLYNTKANTNSIEENIIKTIRKKKPKNIEQLIVMYSELPHFLQDNIFAELKGLNLGYKTIQSKLKKEVN